MSPHLSRRLPQNTAPAFGYSQQVNEESNLRRVASTDIARLHDTDRQDIVHTKVSPNAKRWNSMQNVSSQPYQVYHPHSEEFASMAVDTDPTVNQSQLQAEDGRKYSKDDYHYRHMALPMQHPQGPDGYTGTVSPYNASYGSSVSTPATVISTRVPYSTAFPSHKTPRIHHGDRHLSPDVGHPGYLQSSLSPRSMSSDSENLTGSYSSGTPDAYNDITSWQQRHRDQLKRQQQDVQNVSDLTIKSLSTF